MKIVLIIVAVYLAFYFLINKAKAARKKDKDK